MDSDKLAIFGGSPAVTGRATGRKTKLRRAMRLSADVMTMIPWIARGTTTTVDGSGIVGTFEEEFRGLTGSSFALAMNNGTATLHSAYFAVGVGPGSEVIVPSFTFHATATPILNAEPLRYSVTLIPEPWLPTQMILKDASLNEQRPSAWFTYGAIRPKWIESWR